MVKNRKELILDDLDFLSWIANFNLETEKIVEAEKEEKDKKQDEKK